MVAESTYLARDLTNTPSPAKDPAWFARQVDRPRRYPAATVRCGTRRTLRAEGFGGILAVGGGSADRRGCWSCRGAPAARRHVVLVGKGITFDTGGISIKPAEA